MTDFAEKRKVLLKPLVLIPLLLVVALIVLAIVLLAGGGDDTEEDERDPKLGFAEGDQSRLPGSRRRAPKQAPRVRIGVVDEARRIGRLAVAQARGTIVSPSRVSVRVSAAPKQTVSVNWQLGCFRNRRARVGRGQYRTRAPDVRTIELPMSGATTCIATASAQLTKIKGEGRIKVAVISG